MADEKTGVDSIRIFLTGADTHEGAQTDPDLSLGKYRSSTMFEPLSASWSGLMANIDVVRITGANGVGSGVLTAESADSLSWTPPDGTKGATVSIANGETKLIPGGGGETHKSIVVTRTSTDNLTGTATATLSESFNNLFDNKSAAEATADDEDYRCLALVNVSSSTVSGLKAKLGALGTEATTDTDQLDATGAGSIETTDSFTDWPASGGALIKTAAGAIREAVYYSSRTDTILTIPAIGRGLLGTSEAAGASDDTVIAIPLVRIAKEAPDAQPDGKYTDKTGDGEGSEPAGLTWRIDDDFAGVCVDIGDLDSGEQYGLWFGREAPAGMVNEYDLPLKFQLQFGAV